jgi:hypothetical protein
MNGEARANRVRERLQRRAQAAKREMDGSAPLPQASDTSKLDPGALIGLLHALPRIAATEIASRIVAGDIDAVLRGEEGGRVSLLSAPALTTLM